MLQRVSGSLKIIALLAALLLVSACSGRETPVEKSIEAFDDVRAEVRSVIAEPDRAEAIIGLVDELQQSFDQTREIQQRHIKQFIELNRDYNSTPAQFDALIAATNSDIEVSQERTLGINRRLVAMVSAEEWEALNKARSKAFDSTFKTMNGVQE